MESRGQGHAARCRGRTRSARGDDGGPRRAANARANRADRRDRLGQGRGRQVDPDRQPRGRARRGGAARSGSSMPISTGPRSPSCSTREGERPRAEGNKLIPVPSAARRAGAVDGLPGRARPRDRLARADGRQRAEPADRCRLGRCRTAAGRSAAGHRRRAADHAPALQARGRDHRLDPAGPRADRRARGRCCSSNWARCRSSGWSRTWPATPARIAARSAIRSARAGSRRRRGQRACRSSGGIPLSLGDARRPATRAAACRRATRSREAVPRASPRSSPNGSRVS